MALATQCPHCHTTFRVAADQLKLRGGIVRCGSCQRIFDGNAHLIDLDKPAAPAPVQEDDALPVYTLDFDHTFDPLGILPKPADDVPEPEPEPEPEPVRAHVWRRAPEAEEGPEAAPVAADYAPADRVEPQLEPVVHAAPDTEPEPESEPAEGPVAEPPPPASAYAPADRVEPQLEPVVHAAPDTEPEPEPEPAEDPVAEPPPASAYAPADRIEPVFDLPVTEEIVAQPLPDYEPEPEPEPEPAPEPPARAPASDAPPFLPLRASAASEPPAPAPAMIPPVIAPARSKAARTSEARARRSKLTPTKIEPPKLRLALDADADEPEFVKRSRRQERMGRTQRMLMAAGAVVLLLLLLAQAVLGFRNTLAAQHPGLKPALAGACALLGCRVELPAQTENLVIETGELTTLGPNTYALNTLLRNQGSLVLAWPSIELELTDASDKPVLRRVLAPADYLPRGTSPAGGFGPHSEQPVTLHFTLDGLQPSGYHTFVFYP
ncbi:hypothetical protein ASD28_05615 [Massilia sp. Root133]|uniref:DUF3426 domain-containing protein n=1 Tax=unclassified Massilia TaxID=2609279 RepID=UPI0006F97D87|nr:MULTISPECIES: DUF3426 domain-containing protein [unclassified Massilia]KQY05568.1 hypothetical protein ASD28_05615 [Massilia sp. Root133]KQZ52026.1 hypothetical protein ASD92_15730 [Massilia sp. Root1485]